MEDPKGYKLTPSLHVPRAPAFELPASPSQIFALIQRPGHVASRSMKSVLLFVMLFVSVAGIAWARRTLITTPAGCNAEFGANSGQARVCTACVKSKRKFRLHAKNKGVWVCE